MISAKTKIAVLISGGGTNLQALIDFEKAGKLIDGELVLVATNRKDAYGLERARLAGIEAVYMEKDGFEEKLLEKLKICGVQMIVLAGFLKILSADFIKKFENQVAKFEGKEKLEFTEKVKGRIINIHPSLIPSFCGDGFYGLYVHKAAIDYGVKVSGATVHFVNEVVDGGRIIMQKAVEVLDFDTPQSLQKRIMEEAEWKILPKATQKLAEAIRTEK